MSSRGLVPAALLPLAEPAAVCQLVDDFFAGRKETTLRAYRQGLADFATFLEAGSISEAVKTLLAYGPGEANRLALEYKADMIERNLAPNTINSRLTALRSVVKLARRIGMIVWALDVDGAKSRAYKDTAGPGLQVCRRMLDEVRRRMEGSPRRRMKALRDQAILRLLFDLALRRSSVTTLDLEDVDLEAGIVRVWAKGAEEQDHQARSLPGPTARAIRDWIDLRGDHSGPLFIALDPKNRGRRLSGTGIWRLVDDIARAVGERAWPHGLRHTSITEVVDRSRDVRLGRIQAGHTSISTTQIYIDNLESRDLDQQASHIAAHALGKAVHSPNSHPAGDAARDGG